MTACATDLREKMESRFTESVKSLAKEEKAAARRIQ